MRGKFKKDYWIIKFSGLFDPVYYLKQYPDVRRADIDPLEHFVMYGWKEGRNPNEWFNTREYLEKNPDVAKAGINPFVHWIRWGRFEGREVFTKNAYFVQQRNNDTKLRFSSLIYLAKLAVKNPYYIKRFFQVMKTEGLRSAILKAKNRIIEDYNFKPILINKNRIKMQEKISFPEVANPLVSIIIPVHNKFEFTYNCLYSIYLNTPLEKVEIIIADDGSTDETLNIKKYVEGIKVVRNENALGFIKNCNIASKYAQGEYLVFLNNDTLVQPNWLYYMVALFERYNNVGVVVSKLVYPNGKLQEAGSIIWKDGSTSGYGKGDDPDKPEYLYVREVDYGSGACLMIKKNLFEQIGGFDETFAPAYYEDVDLCLKTWSRGYKVLYQPKSVIIHYEHGTHGSEEAKSQILSNKEKFICKWQKFLEHKHSYSNDNIVKARVFKNKNYRILVLDDCIPAIHRGSGYPRMYNILKMLNELGYEVTFYPITDTYPYEPYLNELQQDGIEVFFGRYAGFENLKDFAKKRKNYYNIVLVSRPHNMKLSFEIIREYFPNAILIYDAEALFSLREIYKKEVLCEPLSHNEKLKMIKEEINLIENADVCISVSKREAERIAKYSRMNKDNIFVYSYPAKIELTQTKFEDREGILFLGTFLLNGCPNEDAILYFVEKIFPIILKNIDSKLYIVGTNNLESISKLASEKIIITGRVDNLKDYFEKTRVFIVPHRYAAGIPLKLLDAMRYGLPSVVSKIIAEQIDYGMSEVFLVGNDPESFAEQCIKLYTNKDLWEKIRKNALEYISQNHSPEVLKSRLKAIIEHKVTKEF